MKPSIMDKIRILRSRPRKTNPGKTTKAKAVTNPSKTKGTAPALAPATVSMASGTVSLAPDTVSLAPTTVSLAPAPVSLAPTTVSLAPAPVSLAPTTVSLAPAMVPQPFVVEAPKASLTPQQWVPVLVLNISKPDSTGVPINAPATNSIATTAKGQVKARTRVLTKGIIARAQGVATVKTIPITTVIPITSTIPLTTQMSTAASLPINQDDSSTPAEGSPKSGSQRSSKEKTLVSLSLPEPPVIPTVLTKSKSITAKEIEARELIEDNTDKPVKCVLCDKNFPSLKEMQVHYLSTHKSRKGREGKKRTLELLESQASSSSTFVSQDVDSEEIEKEGNMSSADAGEPVCPVCRIAFKTHDEVKDHVKKVHSYVCSECNSTFYTLFEFTDHKCNKAVKRAKRGRKKTVVDTAEKSKVAEVMGSFVEIKPITKGKKGKVSPRKVKKASVPPVLEKIQDVVPNEIERFPTAPVLKREMETRTDPFLLQDMPPPVDPLLLAPAEAPAGETGQSEESNHAPGVSDTRIPNQTINAVQINFRNLGAKHLKHGTNSQRKIKALKVPGKEKNKEVGRELENNNEKINADDDKVNASCQTSTRETKASDKIPVAVNEDTFLPSISTAYSLKEDDVEGKEKKKVHVIETRNIHEARQLVGESPRIEFPVPKTEVIKQKLAELKNNPNLSISWTPTLRVKIQDDGDFVCGRCNVLCDDMEDYMDHIQDCLTISSVTLEPSSNPPRRFLKLKNEVSSFSFRESNNNRYSLNQNLISKLHAVLPNAKDYFNNNPQSTTLEGTNISRPTFKDLLDDDFGYESHESADQNTIGSASPVSPDGGPVEPSGVGLPKKVLGSSPKDLGQNKCSVSNIKVAQPMVVIPVTPKINKGSGLLLQKIRNRSEIAEKSQESLACTNGLAAQAFQPLSALSMVHSPLDLLLDPDDIKMEVEEEVIDDHFEIS